MSKKDRKRGQPGPFGPGPETGAQTPPPAVLTGPAAPDQPVTPELPPQETGRPDQSRKHFLILWAVIVLAAAAAWLLALVWPGVSESLIERWLMAALAASLAVFLFFNK